MRLARFRNEGNPETGRSRDMRDYIPIMNPNTGAGVQVPP
jgi:hypothetical protein